MRRQLFVRDAFLTKLSPCSRTQLNQSNLQTGTRLGNDAARAQILQPITKALLAIIGLVKTGLTNLHGADENRRRGGICHTSCLLGFRLVALYQQKIAINEFSMDDLPLPCAGLNNMKVQEK
jgi:hypothetical protein